MTSQPQPTHDPACGKPQHGPGRPRKGWVRVNVASQLARWYCSPACASQALAAAAGLTFARPDVATCRACIARHDQGHTCRSCGHRPPRQLYVTAGRPA